MGKFFLRVGDGFYYLIDGLRGSLCAWLLWCEIGCAAWAWRCTGGPGQGMCGEKGPGHVLPACPASLGTRSAGTACVVSASPRHDVHTIPGDTTPAHTLTQTHGGPRLADLFLGGLWHVQEPAFLEACGGEGLGEEEQWWEGLIPSHDAQLIMTEAQTGSRGVLRDDVSKGQWPLQPLPRLAAQASLYEPHTH